MSFRHVHQRDPMVYTLTHLLGTLGADSGVEGSILLYAIIALAGVGTGVLFVASLIAYSRRQSVRYSLITGAVGMLFLRTLVGFGTVAGITPMLVHHLVEHTFDFLIAALVLSAVYVSKPTRLGTDPEDG